MTQPNRVYLVDDAPDYRSMLRTVFNRFLPAYQLEIFESGDALRQHIQSAQERPRLILLDRHMPGLDGYQILQMLKQHPDWQTVPVAMFSSHTSPEEFDACYRMGANSCLTKPFGLTPLRQLLETTCHYWLAVNQPVKMAS